MKRFLGLILGGLLLSACSRAPQTSAVADNDVASPEATPPAPNIPVEFNPRTGKLVATGDVPLLVQIDRENARVVAAAMPSIVRITATRPTDARVRLFGSAIPFQLPFGPGTHHLIPPNDTAYGSGIVISRDGYVLTNNHVIDDFNHFEVQLHDKRTFSARVVAADELVDVAVLKIEATDLAPISWGDSDKVQVGEQVFAIGNPFDLDDSVSKGIVSAKGRNPEFPSEMTHYEDYIQTDAAINPGNSGGALINIRGELIGLNAAIASTTRFNMGIGFSIPSNLVRYAVQGLLKDGHLVRGFLGVVLPDSVDDGVVDQLDLKTNQGAFLAGILPDSPADKAKLRAFDFITSVDGHKVDSEAELRLVVAQLPIGKAVRIDFIRDGKPSSATLRIAEPPPEAQVAYDSGVPSDDGSQIPLPVRENSGANVLSGLQVQDLNDKTRQTFAVENIVTSGVVVNNVQQGSPADDKGIQRGDVIESLSIDRGSSERLENARDFTTLSGKLKPDQGVALLVYHQKGSSLIYLAPSESE